MVQAIMWRSIGVQVLVLVLAGVYTALSATFQIADPVEFSRIIDTNAVLTTNATLNTWLEGPTWIPSDGGYLVFCDQNNNRLKKLVPPAALSDFVLPPANTLFNGTMLDAQERLIAAAAGSGAQNISMVTNGVIVPLVTNYNGLKFYSPNDVAVKSDSTIWFTDPGYNSGITKPHAGYPPDYYVFQFHPSNATATCRAVMTNGLGRADGGARPNGLCFSPDETKLYVADSGGGANGHRIYVYTVTSSNTLTGGSVFANVTNGSPDGIHCDVDGRVWSSGGDGLYIFAASDGHLIGKIKFIRVVNLCWGGPQYKTLYMVGQPLVTSIPVLIPGPPAAKKLQPSYRNGQLTLSWPAPSTGFVLQRTSGLNAPSSWSNSTLPISITNSQKSVSLDPTNSAGFFRLHLN